jgi:hypothetical protein
LSTADAIPIKALIYSANYNFILNEKTGEQPILGADKIDLKCLIATLPRNRMLT